MGKVIEEQGTHLHMSVPMELHQKEIIPSAIFTHTHTYTCVCLHPPSLLNYKFNNKCDIKIHAKSLHDYQQVKKRI